jgi:hypothetical protein
MPRARRSTALTVVFDRLDDAEPNQMISVGRYAVDVFQEEVTGLFDRGDADTAAP